VKGRTIETNLTTFLQYTNELLDENSKAQIDTIYTDFQKAFDKVNHHILLQKLLQIGLSNSLVGLIGNYLQQSRQYVAFRGVKSHIYKCTSGVPQGGNLAPLL